MSDLAIGAAPSLTGAQSASGDLFPVVDVSASVGSKGKSMTRDELGDAMTRTAALIAALTAKLDTAGGTLTGQLSFSGTTHTGLQLNNLTTVQRNAIAAPGPGMALWNTTQSRMNVHDGSAWTDGFVRLAGDTMTGALANSTNGASSTPVLSLTGAVFTGGTATTTKPSLLIEPTGTTSNNWSTSGTLLGGNAASGFAGNLFELQIAASRRFCVTSTGALLFGSSAATGNVLTVTTTYGTAAAQMVGGGDLWWDKGMIVPATGVVRWGYSGSNDAILTGGTGTLTLSQATLITPASTTTRAGFRIVAGTAPSSPTNGDIWQDGTDIKIRIGGVTKTFTLV